MIHLDASCEPLSDTELNALVAKAQRGDVKARNRVIASTMRLAIRQAHAWARKYDALDHVDDLTQAAVIGHRQERGVGGIMRAVERYDPTRSRWSTYVVYWIDVEISSALTTALTGLSRRENAKLAAAEALRDRLVCELGRDPTAAEMRADAKARGVSPPDAQLCRRALARSVPVDAEGHVSESEVIAELDSRNDVAQLKREIANLPDAMGHAVEGHMRGRPLRITAERTGLSQKRVRELEVEGLERIKVRLAETRR